MPALGEEAVEAGENCYAEEYDLIGETA